MTWWCPPHVMEPDGSIVPVAEAISACLPARGDVRALHSVTFKLDEAGWSAVVFDEDGRERGGASGPSLLDVIAPVYGWLAGTATGERASSCLRADVLDELGLPQ